MTAVQVITGRVWPNSRVSIKNHEEDKSMPINLKRTFILAALVTVLTGSGTALAEVKVGFLGGFTGPLKSMTTDLISLIFTRWASRRISYAALLRDRISLRSSSYAPTG